LLEKKENKNQLKVLIEDRRRVINFGLV